MNSDLEIRQQGFVPYFITYGFSIGLSYTLFAPIERIKIILQTHRLSNISKSEILKKPLEVFTQIRKTQGLLSFWNGNATYVLKEFINLVIRYNIAKIFMKGTINEFEESRFSISVKKYLSIFVSSFCTLSFTYPLEIIRIRLIKDMSINEDKKVFKGLADCMRVLIVKEGFKSLYKGYFFSNAFLIPYLGLSFGIYETVKSKEFLGSAFGSLIFSVSLGQFILYPLDTVRKRLQTNGGIDHLKLYTGARDCFKTVWKNEGVKGFYAGFLLNLIRIMPQAMFQLLMYNHAFDFLEEIRQDNLKIME